jgi:hypothetical protein
VKPPRVNMRGNADGSADFAVDGRPYAELHIPGTQDSTEHALSVLRRMIETAYEKGVHDAKSEIRAALGMRS